jgi:cyanophycinase
MHVSYTRRVFLTVLSAILVVLPAIGAASEPATAPPATDSAPPADSRDYRDANFDYFAIGETERPSSGHTHFLLALMGGGGYVDAAYAAIAKNAGGGHILVLRAVDEKSDDHDSGVYGNSFFTKWGPAISAETIVFHHRAAAFDPRVLAALRRADGIFLAGGDQGNYIRYWKGTPVQDALNAHVRANRPIGGSSAGLAILGHYSYTSLDGGSMESKVALANPFDSGVTLENDFLHLRGLENVITDTHFSKRCRLGRLIVFVARLASEERNPRLFGVGVDERTAVLVTKDGTGKIAEGSAGSAWVVMPKRPAATLAAGEPLTLRDVRILRVDATGSIDLAAGRVHHPAAETVDAIVEGVPSASSIASSIMLRNSVPPGEG